MIGQRGLQQNPFSNLINRHILLLGRVGLVTAPEIRLIYRDVAPSSIHYPLRISILRPGYINTYSWFTYLVLVVKNVQYLMAFLATFCTSAHRNAVRIFFGWRSGTSPLCTICTPSSVRRRRPFHSNLGLVQGYIPGHNWTWRTSVALSDSKFVRHVIYVVSKRQVKG